MCHRDLSYVGEVKAQTLSTRSRLHTRLLGDRVEVDDTRLSRSIRHMLFCFPRVFSSSAATSIPKLSPSLCSLFPPRYSSSFKGTGPRLACSIEVIPTPAISGATSVGLE